MAGSRLIVHEDVHDELIERVAGRAREIVLGNPLEPATEMGPVANAQQFEKVTGILEAALAQGATAVCGGGPDPALGGYFVKPTLLTDVGADSPAVREEIFGPVVAALRFTDEDEAVAMANDTEYGLAGAVWTLDVRRALRVAQRIRAGTVWINAYRVVAPNVPFGGFGASGIGRDNGLDPRPVHAGLTAAGAVDEHAVERAAHADRQRPRQHRGLAEARDLDARRVGHPLRQPQADRLEQQVAVGAQPAAEHDQLDVGHRGQRDDVQRDPARLLVHRRARHAVARARGAEHVAHVVGRTHRGRRAFGQPGDHTGQGGGARVDVPVAARRDIVDLAGRPVAPAVKLPAQHQTRAQPRPDRQEREVLDAAGHTAPLLPQGGEVDVTTVYVTHDQVEAMTLGHRVAVLRDGRLQQCDTPRRIYDHPANVFVARFMGSPAMNLCTLLVRDAPDPARRRAPGRRRRATPCTCARCSRRRTCSTRRPASGSTESAAGPCPGRSYVEQP
jgi:hypothetical protein